MSNSEKAELAWPVSQASTGKKQEKQVYCELHESLASGQQGLGRGVLDPFPPWEPLDTAPSLQYSGRVWGRRKSYWILSWLP
jgi:hypothetical protein